MKNAFFPLVIDTPRLWLRTMVSTDIPGLMAYRSDPEVARYQSWTAPYTQAQAQAVLDEVLTGTVGMRNRWYQMAIERREDGCLIGDIGFILFSEEAHQAEIGFSLAPQYQRQGYATEAVRGMLHYLFMERGLHRVRGHCVGRNVRSARLLERVGMRCEGHFRNSIWFKGEWSDELWYAMLAQEYLESRKSPTPATAPQGHEG
jgi:aminoglycoside 6'-N-acetyltransferase